MFVPYLTYILTVIVFILLLRFVFKFTLKRIFKFVINIIVGGLILFLVNYIPGINITLDVIKSIVVGILGVPGVIIVIIYYFLIEK